MAIEKLYFDDQSQVNQCALVKNTYNLQMVIAGDTRKQIYVCLDVKSTLFPDQDMNKIDNNTSLA